jgi:hypothetical protein
MTASTGSYRAVFGGIATGGGAFYEYGAFEGGGLVQQGTATQVAIPEGQWNDVLLEIAFGPQAKLVFRVNGMVVVSSPAHELGSLVQSTGQVLDLGVATYAGGPPDWRVYYDDVVCDSIP